VAVLHHRIDGVAGIGAGPRGPLRDEPTVGIGPGSMRGVAPLLPSEVNHPIATIRGAVLPRRVLGAQPPLVLCGIERHLDRHEALEAGVGPHQGAVGTDVPTDQAGGHRPLDRVVEELLQEPRLVKAPAPVLAERRGVPGVLVEVQAHEPAQCHVALQLHHQLPLARDPQQITAHQGQEQLLGRDRGAPDRGVQIPAGPPNRRVLDERPNRPQGCSSGTNVSSDNW